MAASTQKTMDNVERRRQQLEENVTKLRTALHHWSAWEMEYEMLKEELQKADSPSPAEMVEIGRDLGGTLVNENEVTELLGKDLQTERTANQVVDMISRRIDYVQQNRSTVEKQLEGVSILLDPGLENEEGLPMMDIEEELDDDENVVSSSVTQPGKVPPDFLDALRKAGLHKAEQDPYHDARTAHAAPSSAAPASSTPVSAPKSTPVSASKSIRPRSIAEKSKQAPDATGSQVVIKSRASETPLQKKFVSFSDDVKVETFAKPPGLQDDLKNWNLKPGQRVYELDSDENIVASAVVPREEGPEDAKLRREMLQYGLSEVGGVVAELDLDDEDRDDYSEEDDSGESEEDEHGRSTQRYLTDEYRQQMMELEKKMNARMLENVGPHPDLHPLAEHADDVRTLRVRKDEDFPEQMNVSGESSIDASQTKKGVRFADKLDISDGPEPVTHRNGAPQPSRLTMSDTIVERSPSAPQPPTAPSRPAKVSQFKSARASPGQPPPMLPTPAVPEQPPVPSGPPGRTLATTVVEHTPQPSEPHAPDEFDPVVINREIQTEYHKMRNKMIQQQGGFTAAEEDQEDALVEERDGQTKKVSRFKAARLKAEGL